MLLEVVEVADLARHRHWREQPHGREWLAVRSGAAAPLRDAAREIERRVAAVDQREHVGERRVVGAVQRAVRGAQVEHGLPGGVDGADDGRTVRRGERGELHAILLGDYSGLMPASAVTFRYTSTLFAIVSANSAGVLSGTTS